MRSRSIKSFPAFGIGFTRFTVASAVALLITAAAPAEDRLSHLGIADTVATAIGHVLMAALGINDALAGPGGGGGGGGGAGGGGAGGGGAGGGGAGGGGAGGGGGNNNGGFQAGCSDNLTSNSINSVQDCEREAVFTLCESEHSGEAGREIVVLANGLMAINKIRCD